MLEIQRNTIDTLVALRWLPADQQDDLSAIAKAFRRLAGRALAVARNCGSIDGTFLDGAQRSGAPPGVTRNSGSPYLHP
jgi:hypothetical protein